MNTVNEALTLLKRQAELETAMKRPGGIRARPHRIATSRFGMIALELAPLLAAELDGLRRLQRRGLPPKTLRRR
jgi:hypothetical protein